MAISVNWNTKVILVPQADLTFISGVQYELDVNAFRLALKDIEDDEGMPFLDTHRHNTEVTLSGVTYARTFEIINGYTIEFEDGQYVVTCVGANHNIADVKVANQVSLIIGNSAGLIVRETVVAGAPTYIAADAETLEVGATTAEVDEIADPETLDVVTPVIEIVDDAAVFELVVEVPEVELTS